jgi:two-component system, response regulator PdtaR
LEAVDIQQEKEPTPPIVLIVEDDIVIRSPLAEYLRAAGYSIVQAANAAEAVALFAAGVPIDVVFSDIRMPGSMDGLGLARWIRQHHPEVRVALTSGNGNGARAARVAKFYLPKPYQAAEVAARIGQLLREATPPTRSAAPASTSSHEPVTGSPPTRPRGRRQSATKRPRRPKSPGDHEDPS